MLASDGGKAQRDAGREAQRGACHHRVMRFLDRADAGDQLAPLVAAVVEGPVVVLGVPRGGVSVAAAVAKVLDAPLDVVVPKKVGAPGNPELGLGAVAPGVRVLDQGLIERLGVTEAYLEAEIAREEAEVERRAAEYRAARPPVDVVGRTAVIVDDGVATGGTALASVAWARAAGASRVIFAAPVAPPEAVERLRTACDDVIVIHAPRAFFAVGEWYEHFGQVTDDEVKQALGVT
jgi:predicted phosphoribosyltransferase